MNSLRQAWAALPPRYQAALKYAGYYAMTDMLAGARHEEELARKK